MILKLFIILITITNIYALNCDQVIIKKEYKVCYSYEKKGALAEIYKLSGDFVNRRNIKNRPKFYSEKSIPKQYRVVPSDYVYSTSSNNKKLSFSRGHLAPDADFDYSSKSLNNVYSMVNILPQISELNRGTWADLECYERKKAQELGKLIVKIYPEYKTNSYLVKKDLSDIKNMKKWTKKRFSKFNKRKRRLEKGKIAIPSGFWKVLEYKNFKECYHFDNANKPLHGDNFKKHKFNCSLIGIEK